MKFLMMDEYCHLFFFLSLFFLYSLVFSVVKGVQGRVWMVFQRKGEFWGVLMAVSEVLFKVSGDGFADNEQFNE